MERTKFVAVVKDVQHRSPWLPYMNDLFPAGSLVVVTQSYSCSSYKGWQCHTGHYVEDSSIEIIGEL